MKIKMVVVTFKGVKYRGEKPPSRRGMKASEREREIRSLIDEGKLIRVEPRGESKRPPAKRHCAEWRPGPKPRGKAPIVEVIKPSKLEEKKAEAPKKKRGRPAKKAAMAEKMRRVRAAKKKN